MDSLPGWENASAAILSCPGPLRRQTSSLLPVGELALPQVLLGGESQLLAFAAAASGLAGKLFFAPMPEMFPDLRSLRAAWMRAGGDPQTVAGTRPVHLRFGSVRAARVLKGVRNACVVAEADGGAPLTASHHPFASGMVLPAAMRRLFLYHDATRPRVIGGAAIPASMLPQSCVTADLPPDIGRRGYRQGAELGLDLVSLGDFRSLAWAAGPVRGRAGRLLAGMGHTPAVLVPWNMDHPGSIVPDLLERLVRLHPGARGDAAIMPRILLLPFNYVGQTGIIRRLIARLREAAHSPESVLGDIYMARTSTLDAVALLRGVAGRAWVDGNDPEHWWTLARLHACGVETILIDAGTDDPGLDDPRFADPRLATTRLDAAGVADERRSALSMRLQADESIWVEAETRCGTLTFPARLPSLRALPGLMRLTADRVAGPPRPRPRRTARRQPIQAAP